MYYCSAASVYNYLIGVNKDNTATSIIVEEAVEDATNEINRYLSKRYDVSEWNDSELVAKDLVFYAGFEEDINPTFYRSGEKNCSNACAYIIGKISYDNTNQNVDFLGTGVIKYKTGCLTGTAQAAAFMIDYTPNFSGAPTSAQYLLVYGETTTSNSAIYILRSGANLSLQMNGATGSSIINKTIALSGTAGQTYNIYGYYDLTNGDTNFALDGVFTEAPTNITSTRDITATGFFAIGGAVGGGNYSNAKITNLKIWRDVPYKTDFSTSLPFEKLVVNEVSTTVPPSIRSICKKLAAAETIEATSRGGKESLARSKALHDRCIMELKEIASGEADIVNSVGAVITPANNVNAVYSTTEDYSNTFNEDTSTSWKTDYNKLTSISSERD